MSGPGRRALVVIPAYGEHECTRNLLDDIQGEHDLVGVLVVDNLGSLVAPDWVRCHRPAANLGWLRSCNLGLRAGAEQGYEQVVLLNNDVRLSPGFFAALIAVGRKPGVGMCGPYYDDMWHYQHSHYSGPARGWPGGGSASHPVPCLDGTCLSIPVAAYRTVGGLDEAHFGRYGWAADFDLAVRFRRAGYEVHVAEGAYLNHLGQMTARRDAKYAEIARADGRRGLQEIYGPQWLTLFGEVTEMQRLYGTGSRELPRLSSTPRAGNS